MHVVRACKWPGWGKHLGPAPRQGGLQVLIAWGGQHGCDLPCVPRLNQNRGEARLIGGGKHFLAFIVLTVECKHNSTICLNLRAAYMRHCLGKYGSSVGGCPPRPPCRVCAWVSPPHSVSRCKAKHKCIYNLLSDVEG